MISIRSLYAGYNGKNIVENINIDITEGESVSILGPNGSGKSTLLKCMGRLLSPKSGEIILDGRDIQELPTKIVAQKLGILPQNLVSPDDITVYELISYGRNPYKKLFCPNKNDEEIIDWAIKQVKLEPFKNKKVSTLSGGERQRAWIGMVLAQKTNILLLDEPTTYLDIHHQMEILDLLENLKISNKLTVIMVLHDLNHAIRFSDKIILMKNGRILASGSPDDVLNEEIIKESYNLTVRFYKVDYYKKRNCIICVPY